MSKCNRKVVFEDKRKDYAAHQFEKTVISTLSERKINLHNPVHKLVYP